MTGKKRAEDKISIYYSHSYRGRDREVNAFFWELFWRAGFTFSVDPHSDVLSTPYLEYMMKGSAGFVAVVTRRPEQQFYLCSPFILYEYGLALLAHKPRLIFVEHSVAGRFFPPGNSDREVFRRNDLEADRERFKERIRHFSEKVRPYRRAGSKLRGKA